MNEEEIKIESIVKQYLKPVYNLSFRLVQSREMAEDITQEVFVKVWKNLDKYDPKQNFKTWLFAIARNTSIDWLRKKRSIAFSELEDRESLNDSGYNFSDQLVDPELLPEELFARSEIKEQLTEALNRISFEERTIILLHLQNDLSFAEISQIVNRPQNTVKSQYRRALIRLRRFLQVAPK